MASITMFQDFVELVGALAECDGHKDRSSMISRFIRDGPNGISFFRIY